MGDEAMEKELLLRLADELDKQGDERRERAIKADAEKGGPVPDELCDRWASSFATAYQTLRGAAAAVRATAEGMEAPALFHPPYKGPIEPGMRFIWEPTNSYARAEVEVLKLGNTFNEPSVLTRGGRGLYRQGDEYWNTEERFREACWQGPITVTEGEHLASTTETE
jgi:hypothetical protein